MFKLSNIIFVLAFFLGAIYCMIPHWFDDICSSSYERQGIKLIKFPGTKKVKLHCDDYAVWVFTRWKNKGVDCHFTGSSAVNTMQILELRNKNSIKLEDFDCPSYQSVSDLRAGEAWYKLHIENEGEFLVSCPGAIKEPFIVVLAPLKTHHYNLGSSICFDCF